MVAFDRSVSCEDAEAYYQDFLLGPDGPSVPAPVAEHLRQCPHCIGQVKRLSEILAQSGGGGGCAEMDLVAELQRHFDMMGERVDCRQVKALLPTLLIPSLRIRVPTPATVHIDHCGQCAQDLGALKHLDLDAEQLTRLSRLYADEAGQDNTPCGAVDLERLGSVSLAGLDSAASRHFCLCSKCRDEVYDRRQTLLERLWEAQTGGTCSRGLPMAEIFDYVVPYGRDADVSEELAAHIRSCPVCLEKLQLLHSAMYGILDRAASPVATVYTADDSTQADVAPSDDPYASHSVQVEVFGADGAAESAPAARRISGPIARMALLAAAMIPLAVFLWFGLPSASGLSVNQVVDVALTAPVVHIVVRDSLYEPNGLGAEVWITPEMVVFRQRQVRMPASYGLEQAIDTVETMAFDYPRTVYDLVRNRKCEPDSGPGASRWQAFGEDEITGIKRSIYGLLSFSSQAKGQLRRIESEADADAAVAENSEVWEVAWEEPSTSGELVEMRLLAHIDALTRRPEMIEYSQTVRDDVSVQTTYFSYPPESEAQEYLSTLVLP